MKQQSEESKKATNQRDQKGEKRGGGRGRGGDDKYRNDRDAKGFERTRGGGQKYNQYKDEQYQDDEYYNKAKDTYQEEDKQEDGQKK